MSEPRPLVIYHDNCPDGFTAAWAVWRALGDTAEYLPATYGQPHPLAKTRGRRVILVDFSYPRAALEEIAQGVGTTVEVYDHHKTARDDLTSWSSGKVVFDMERSGAGIAWDEFTEDKEALWLGVRPWLIAYVEDRDLWRWKLPDSREVSEYLFSLDRTFAEWSHVDAAWGSTPTGRAGLGPAIEAGRALLRAKRLRVAAMCANARMMTFEDGTRLPGVNASWDFSEIGERLCEQFPDAPAGGYYFDRADKRQWGFRSRGGFDVSALCKRHGGGGHAAAAGFESEIGWLP